MAVISRSLDDLILDRMIIALQTFSAEQEAIDPVVGFTVERDAMRPPAKRKYPYVNGWLESLDTQREGSTARTHQQELARYNFDCYARGVDSDDSGIDDQKAMARLAYLKEQVKAGLYRLINSDFGFSSGIIGRKRWPNWRLFQDDLKFPEHEIVAGRWSLEVEYLWSPEDIEGIEIDEIFVDVNRWSASYQYGGE